MAKRALCVGINDYPDSSMDLAGCVNDASDWRQVLEGRGYLVTSLLDAEATRQRMLDALDQLVSPASDGDALVFTFSGHGSWMPDADADEPDARDEMLCPHDVMQDHYVLDDDLHERVRPEGGWCTPAGDRGLLSFRQRHPLCPGRARTGREEGAFPPALRAGARRPERRACHRPGSLRPGASPALFSGGPALRHVGITS